MRSWLEKIVVAVSGAAAVAALFLFGLAILNSGKIVFGLKVAAVTLGGTPLAAAEARIQHLAETFAQASVRIEIPEKKFAESATPPELGISVDVKKTAEESRRYGRSRNMLAGIYEQVRALSGKTKIPAEVTMDTAQFEAKISQLVKEIEQPPVNAALILEDEQKTFTVSPARKGLALDRRQLRERLLQASRGLPPTIHIAMHLTEKEPAINNDEVNTLLPDAQRILRDVSPSLTYQAVSWPIDEDLLAPWLTVVKRDDKPILDLRKESVQEYLVRDVVPAIHRPPVNAQFTLKNGKVAAFALSQDGIELDIEGTFEALRRTVFLAPENKETLGGENESSAPPVRREITVLTRPIPAEVTTESIDTLGITALLAAGESDFAGSPKNRMHNIRVGAARFNGTLLKPGEEFSFNTLLGNVGPEEGYLPELVIKQNKTVPEYGGGLCQVATTAFRAAVLSGLAITERSPHSYVVRYYGKPGFDATIYPPRPDLKFKNDTTGHILIQTKVVKTKLYFEFYGTNDGRAVNIIGPRVYDQKPDGSAKATLTQQILYDGEVTREKTFRSSYRSPALYPVEKRNPLE